MDKACAFLAVCALVTLAGAQKPGHCPPARPDAITICLARCTSDDSCPGIQKCCAYGCMLDCQNPVGVHGC